MSTIGGPRLSTIPPTFFNDYSFEFDGISEYAQPSTQTSTEDTSFSCWIKTTETFVYTDSRCAFGGRASVNGGNYTLGRLGSAFSSPNDMKVRCFNTLGTTKLNDDMWHHIVFTHDFTTKETKAYVDGNLEVTVTFPANSNLFNVAIGWNGFASSTFFEGSIDECAWFTSVLTPSVINTIYGTGIPNDISSLNPKAWYRMGDNSLYKSPQWLLPSNENKDKVSNYSMSFDGTDDYIDCGTSIGDSLGDNYTGDLSVSVWFKTNIVTPTNDGIFSIGDFANSVGEFTISIYNNGLYYRLNNGGWTKTVAFTDTTSWHHLLVIYKSGSEADSKMFLDGADVGTASGTFPTTSLMDFAGLKTTIGAYYSQAIAMNGNIDEVAIFNNDQTANAADIYNLGVPTDLTSLSPLAWYRMGENAVFRDPQWLLPSNENKDNYSNYSLDFDGVNDSIIFLDPKDIGETQQISYSVWVNLDVTTTQYIAGNWLSSNGGTGIQTLTGDVLLFQIADGTNDSYFNSRVSNFSTYAPTGTWNHILATWDGTDSKIYINGVLRNTWTPAGGYTISGYSTTGFKIGWRGQFANSTNGRIDDLGVFDSGVSIGDVWDGSGKPIDISTVSGITHNWRLGENATFDGTNWTLPDIVGSKPGTSTNMGISDRVGNAPNSINNALSLNMDINDRVGDAPGSENNALSYNMVLSGRTSDVPT